MNPEPTSPRKLYYKPLLDPEILQGLEDGLTDEYAEHGHPFDGLYDPLTAMETWGEEPNCKSSRCEDGLHRPALDIDIPMIVTPSSTPGHHHLEFPTLALKGKAYKKLLRALAEAGVIEEGYANVSIDRGESILRLAHIKKP